MNSNRTTMPGDETGTTPNAIRQENGQVRFSGRFLALKITNNPKANDLVRREYRKGWAL